MRTTRDIVVAALMATILTISKYALDALPNIELVSMLVVIFALLLPKHTLGAIYGYVFLYGLLNGFGIWWVPQVYLWLVLYLITRLFKNMDNAVFWAVISGAFGLFYGALYSLSYVVMNGVYAGIAWWIAGLPFDLLHCIGNFVVMLMLYRPVHSIIVKCKTLIKI